MIDGHLFLILLSGSYVVGFISPSNVWLFLIVYSHFNKKSWFGAICMYKGWDSFRIIRQGQWIGYWTGYFGMVFSLGLTAPHIYPGSLVKFFTAALLNFCLGIEMGVQISGSLYKNFWLLFSFSFPAEDSFWLLFQM